MFNIAVSFKKEILRLTRQRGSSNRICADELVLDLQEVNFGDDGFLESKAITI